MHAIGNADPDERRTSTHLIFLWFDLLIVLGGGGGSSSSSSSACRVPDDGQRRCPGRKAPRQEAHEGRNNQAKGGQDEWSTEKKKDNN